MKKSSLEVTVKEYLKEPLSLPELENLFAKLGKTPGQVIRVKESIYKELGLGEKNLGSKELMEIIIDHPKLLERPILLTDEKAVIGRPPENLIELLEG